MLDCAGLKAGIVILRNYITREQIAPLIKNTVVDGYEFLEDDKNVIRERFLSDVAAIETIQDPGTGTMPVDHFSMCEGLEQLFLDR